MGIPGERRDDVGYKTTITVLGSVVAILLGLFANAAWSTAGDSVKKADNALNRIFVLETKFEAIGGDLKEIKDILRRGLPGASTGRR